MPVSRTHERMLDRLQKKIGENLGHKADLHLADYRVISNEAAHVILSYVVPGKISGEGVLNFMINTFGHEVVPIPSTIVHHAKLKAVSFVGLLRTNTRPAEDAEEMICVAASLYLDKQMQDTWQAVTGDDGTPYLKRVRKESIADILAARKRHLQAIPEGGKVVTARTVLGSFNPMDGDVVRFFRGGRIYRGEIKNITRSGGVATYTVKVDNRTFKQAQDTIVDVVTKGEKKTGAEEKSLVDFFTQMYGDQEFAKNLVNPQASVDAAVQGDADDVDLPNPSVPAFEMRAVLRRVYRKDNKRNEWALLSKTSGHVLKWFGTEKPSKESVAKEEQRIQYFKHSR